MIEVHTWIFVVMVVALIIGSFYTGYQEYKIKKLKKNIKHWENCSHPG